MKIQKIIFLSILILSMAFPVCAAKVLFTVDITRTSGTLTPQTPSASAIDSEETDGLCYMKGREKKGGFSGWAKGELKRLKNDPTATTADVYLWTSEEKLVKMSKAKKEGKFKYRIKKLRSEKAKLKKGDLDPDNNGS